MNPLAIFALGVAAIFAINSTAKVSAVNAMQFVIHGIKLSPGITPVLYITIGVQNVSEQRFTVNSLTGTLYINGVSAGNVSSFQVADIRVNAETPYTVSVRLSLSQVVSQLRDIIEGDSPVKADLRLVGNVNVDHQVFPLDLSYKII